MINRFYKILDLSIEKGASDIHLTNKLQPTLRIDGKLCQLENLEHNTSEALRIYIKELLNEIQLKKYEKEKEIDASITYNDVRFRIHIFKQSGADAIALRIIPRKIPTLEEINMPSVLKKFTTYSNGLILITGITGSGKTTTLASLINEINNNYSKHIITIEDPIEYIHEHKKSMINQREVGADVHSFSKAVRASVREDPDILLVGEMRDLETMQNAITMAETGHLVFGTLHTRSVAETINRIIDIFPPNQQEQIRTQLAASINGIISQELLPMVGGGRVPCCEIMVANDAIRSLIRDNSPPNLIIDQIQTNSRKLGSQTKIQGLAKLIIEKKIKLETAHSALKEEDLELLNRTIISLSKKGE